MPIPLIIAHRGDSSSALENSLEAFRLALSVPVDMIELDLRMSRDGVLYVMHDRETGRTADRNIDIEQSLSSQVDGIRLRNQEPVPRFEDALGLIAGKAGINMEIKSDGAGAALSTYLSGLPAQDSFMVSSFKEAEVQSVRTALPAMACALIFDAFSLRHLAEYRARGYTRISLRKNTVTEPLVRACHGRGVQVFVWTVDEEDEMKRCIEWEVDGIYTNRPRVLKQVLNKSV